MNNSVEIIEIITTLLVWWLSLQVGISALTILLGDVLVEHVELGIFRNTKNPILKFITFITLFLVGLGPTIYKKLNKCSWLVRRLLMLIITLVMGILFIFIYYIIKSTLHAVFL
jgi:hypothetical protein